MVLSHEVSFALPVETINLGDWLYNLSDSDYQACARGHRAAGTNGGSRFEGMVNVESMAGALIVQHYRTEVVEADHVRLFSKRSQGFLMHLVPFHFQVVWEMWLLRESAGSSTLRCTIEVKNPLWIRIAGYFNASEFWIRRHLIEETGGFARDIIRKANG